jgi:hypothetical protein
MDDDQKLYLGINNRSLVTQLQLWERSDDDSGLGPTIDRYDVWPAARYLCGSCAKKTHLPQLALRLSLSCCSTQSFRPDARSCGPSYLTYLTKLELSRLIQSTDGPNEVRSYMGVRSSIPPPNLNFPCGWSDQKLKLFALDRFFSIRSDVCLGWHILTARHYSST